MNRESPERFRTVIVTLSFAGLVLGWRGIPLWGDLRLYASELFIWAGFAISTIAPVKVSRIQVPHQVNVLPVFLAVSTVLAVGVGFANAHDPREILGQAKAMFCFVPALVVFRKWIHSEDEILPYAVAFVVAGTVVALLGCLEFFVPGVANALPWLFTGVEYTRANFGGGGTMRLSGFNAWGTPVVGVVLVPAFGFWIAIRKRLSRGYAALSLVAAGTIFAGILLSGYRSAWGGMVCIALVLFLFDRRIFTGMLLAGLVLLYALPHEFIDRFTTIWLLGESGDTSLLRRQYTLHLALVAIQKSPLWGSGWGSFSVYNDFGYFALALGIPAFAAFCLWYISIIVRNWKIARRALRERFPATRMNPAGFLAALVGYLFCMMSGAMTNVQPLLITFWLMFCLVLRYAEVAGMQNGDRPNIPRVGIPAQRTPNRPVVAPGDADEYPRI